MAELTAAARTVLEARYLLKDERGEVAETPEEMFRRVARAVAAADREAAPGIWPPTACRVRTSRAARSDGS